MQGGSGGRSVFWEVISDCEKKSIYIYIYMCVCVCVCVCVYIYIYSGFGSLGVACWPLVPKFAGSNPAEAVGFLGRKNPQHAFLRRGSKAIGPMS